MRRTSRMLAALAGVAALTAAPAAAVAAPGWTSAAPLPESPTAGYPDVALDADGAATALWMQAGIPAGIKVATKPDGGRWSQPSPLAGTHSTSGFASLAVAPDGVAAGVWYDGTAGEIQAAYRDADGVWSVDPISSVGPDVTSEPSLTFAADGTVTAAWAERCTVVVATRPARSADWSNPVQIFAPPAECRASTGMIQRPVALGTDRTGNLTAVWRTGTSSALSLKEIRSSVRTGGPRGTWSAPKLVAAPAGNVPNRAHEPELVVDVDGRAVVAWPLAAGGAQVATRPAGTDETWNATLTSLASPTASTPSIALDGHGRASVAWDVTQDGATPPAVKLKTVSPADVWTEDETVATFPLDGEPAFRPQLRLDDDGGALVAWSRRQASAAAVEAARRPAGGAWSAVETIATDAPPSTVADLAGDALGNATVIWPVGPTAPDPGETSALTALASADFNAEPALTADWSGRTERTFNSLRSWVTYLYNGGGGVELSDGATWPYEPDRYSWRWAQQDAWRDVSTGELVIEQRGTLRFSYPDHFIDIRLVDPTLRVAADGRSARLISSGQASGSMADARAGRGTLTPFTDLHVLDIDLDAGGYRAGEAVGRRSWIGAPATMTQVADQTLGRLGYAGSPFGRLTFSAPISVPDRDPRPPVDPPRPPVDPPRPPVDPPRPPANPVGRPVLRSVRSAKVNRSGIANVATIRCQQGPCRVRVPRSVRVRVGRKRYVLRVRAPRTLSAGKRGAVTVHLSRAQRKRLAGRKLKIRFSFSVTSGTTTATRTVRATLTVPRAATAGRGGRRR